MRIVPAVRCVDWVRALLGGRLPSLRGEVSLALYGVLILAELPDFNGIR